VSWDYELNVHDSVPFEDADWIATPDERREELLAEAFKELRGFWADAKFHDRNGWFADEAGSDRCRELGHDEDAFEDEETHPPSFDGDALCGATRYGVCCTECESGDCPYLFVRSVWDWPIVRGVAS
jgi:hypothetical protein